MSEHPHVPTDAALDCAALTLYDEHFPPATGERRRLPKLMDRCRAEAAVVLAALVEQGHYIPAGELEQVGIALISPIGEQCIISLRRRAPELPAPAAYWPIEPIFRRVPSEGSQET